MAYTKTEIIHNPIPTSLFLFNFHKAYYVEGKADVVRLLTEAGAGQLDIQNKVCDLQ